MKKRRFTSVMILPLMLLSIFIFHSKLFANGQERGGGSVVFIDGKFRMTDLLSQNEIEKLRKEDPAKIKAAFDTLWKRNPRVTQLGEQDGHFFDCIMTKLKDHEEEFPIFKTLRKDLLKLIVIQGEEPLEYADYIRDETHSMYYGTKLLPLEKQRLIVQYNRKGLLSSKRIYDALEPKEKEVLALREALRYAIYQNRDHYNWISHDTLEVIVRYFFHEPREGDKKELPQILEKLKRFQKKSGDDDFGQFPDIPMNILKPLPPCVAYDLVEKKYITKWLCNKTPGNSAIKQIEPEVTQ